jgi:hypothetical protein
VSDILSEAEIRELTKPRTQGAAQARHLARLLGCQVKRRPDGLPIITRQMLSRLNSEAKAQNDAGITWSKRA